MTDPNRHNAEQAVQFMPGIAVVYEEPATRDLGLATWERVGAYTQQAELNNGLPASIDPNIYLAEASQNGVEQKLVAMVESKNSGNGFAIIAVDGSLVVAVVAPDHSSSQYLGIIPSDGLSSLMIPRPTAGGVGRGSGETLRDDYYLDVFFRPDGTLIVQAPSVGPASQALISAPIQDVETKGTVWGNNWPMPPEVVASLRPDPTLQNPWA